MVSGRDTWDLVVVSTGGQNKEPVGASEETHRRIASYIDGRSQNLKFQKNHYPFFF